VKPQTIFFDLDGTLYPDVQGGVWDAMRQRIELYMQHRVGIPKSKVRDLRDSYLARYGTTLRGLYLDYQIDPDDYLVFVHDIPIEEMIRPNGKLGDLLSRLSQRKWIFTNSSLEHSRRVLAALGISAHFDGIIDIKAMNFRNKPELRSYTLAFERAGLTEAMSSLFVDDQPNNLDPAKKLGAGTILVGSREPHPSADCSIARIEELLLAMPTLIE
jgi:putative hydrolase of the HAD superfamily